MTLQRRVLFLFLGLLLLVLVVTMVTVSQTAYRHTMDRAQQEMTYARRIFLDKLAARQQALLLEASTLAKDDALRHAIFSEAGDRESLLLALNNHRDRAGADVSFLVDLDTTERADTADPRRLGHPFPFPDVLYETPEKTPARLQAAVLDGVAYQLATAPVYVPVSAPQPSIWLVLGRALDDPLEKDLHDLIGVDVSIVIRGGSQREPVVLASSLDAEARRALTQAVRVAPASDSVEVLPFAGDTYLAASAPLPSSGPFPVQGLLLRATSDALLDYRKLLGTFLLIAVAAALLAVGSAVLLARGVTRPIRGLEEAAQRIAAGDYAAALPLSGTGEVARLAHEFAAMQAAVRDREEAIEHLAFHDDLTGLPNRNHFQRALAKNIEVARRDHGRLAVVILDLDRFKDINDALGHHIGDRLLLAVAERLRGVAAERSAEIARLGGDEFALLLPVRSLGETRETVDAVQQAVTGAIEIDELRVDTEASAGISLFPEHGADPASLLKRAEVAMYVAKHRRLGAVFYESSQDRHSIERLSLVGDLRRAVKEDALSLAFQPQVGIPNGHADAVEVLLRWNHPRLGPVSPAEFVPIAEQTGVIRELTAWVLRHAIQQAAAWRRDGLELAIAVNLSALDLHDPALPRRIGDLLMQNDLPARSLVLEITESSVMAEPETARRLLDELNGMGVAISVDDFGTGYSSLSQLKRLPVQELKVDKSFVLEITRSADVRQIVRSTIELGHNLGLRVVGEGVETHDSLRALRDMGCDIAQGHFISEPLAAAELVRWMNVRRRGVERLVDAS